jgi:ribose-phosphate pyrophosphokinase
MLKLTFQYPATTNLLEENYVNVNVPFKTWVYSGGEVQVRLVELPKPPAAARLFALLCNPKDFIELLMLTNAIKEAYPGTPIHLRCPYLPGARQDRVCSPGDAFALKVFAQLLNAQEYASVEVLDPHSNVALELVDRIYPLDAAGLAADVLKNTVAGQNAVPDWSKAWLIQPDHGAAARTTALAALLNIQVFGTAAKKRDPTTGEITGMEIHKWTLGECKGHTLIIADDICDGGRTFIELAKVLRRYQPKAIVLYVSHGIFSKGLAVFDGYIDHVLSSYSFQ